MEKSSKSLMEIFREKYPMKDISKNSFMMAEAMGYLNCLYEFAPSLEDEIKECKSELCLMMILNSL